MQTRFSGAKHASPFLHTKTRPTHEEYHQSMELIVARNPGLRDFVKPDYQHNFFDPPFDYNTTHFLNDLRKTWPGRRHKLLRKFLPKDLHHYKSFVSQLPIAQLQEIREHLYIGRVGDLGTNDPCRYSRRHWMHRLTSSNNPIHSNTLKQLTFAERVRWYETAILNLTVDAAEEEYLRYRYCMSNRMPLVEKASINNTAHYNPHESAITPIGTLYPPVACQSLMGLVHDAHRHFGKLFANDCGHHHEAFYQALVRKADLTESLLTYDRIQRCALGREIRARVMTKPPTFAGAWALFGTSVPDQYVPAFLINHIEVRDNPLLKYKELDTDLLPIFDNINAPKIKPLLDELRQELIDEGRLAGPKTIPTPSGVRSAVQVSPVEEAAYHNAQHNAKFDAPTVQDRLFDQLQLTEMLSNRFSETNPTTGQMHFAMREDSDGLGGVGGFLPTTGNNAPNITTHGYYTNPNPEHSFVDLNDHNKPSNNFHRVDPRLLPQTVAGAAHAHSESGTIRTAVPAASLEEWFPVLGWFTGGSSTPPPQQQQQQDVTLQQQQQQQQQQPTTSPQAPT